MIEDGRHARPKPGTTGAASRKLSEVLDDERRYHIVRMMWQIVYADGKPNESEANIIWRAADLLGGHRDNV
jgi:uncharacterized tellurite resistance protein B-like protein